MKVAGTLLAATLIMSGWMLVREFRPSPVSAPVQQPGQDNMRKNATRTPPRRASTPGRVTGNIHIRDTSPALRHPLNKDRALSNVHALDLLPPDTLALLWTDSYEHILDRLGAYDLLENYRHKLDHIEDGLAKAGLVMEDFLTLENIGLDSSAPAVMALTGRPKSSAIVFAFRIGDSARLQEVLLPIAESLSLIHI